MRKVTCVIESPLLIFAAVIFFSWCMGLVIQLQYTSEYSFGVAQKKCIYSHLKENHVNNLFSLSLCAISLLFFFACNDTMITFFYILYAEKPIKITHCRCDIVHVDRTYDSLLHFQLLFDKLNNFTASHLLKNRNLIKKFMWKWHDTNFFFYFGRCLNFD